MGTTKQPADNEATIVMIDPAKGFIPGNVLTVSYKASVMLDQMPNDQRIALITKIEHAAKAALHG